MPLVVDVPGLGEVREGDEVSGAGGYFEVVSEGVTIPDSCGTERGVVFRAE